MLQFPIASNGIVPNWLLSGLMTALNNKHRDNPESELGWNVRTSIQKAALDGDGDNFRELLVRSELFSEGLLANDLLKTFEFAYTNTDIVDISENIKEYHIYSVLTDKGKEFIDTLYLLISVLNLRSE